MKITNILINHMTSPIGFDLKDLRIEYQLQAARFVAATQRLLIWTQNPEHPVYQTEWQDTDHQYFDVSLSLQPRTRYRVRVLVKTATDTINADSYFETGKMQEPYSAKWIGNQNKSIQNTLFKKIFHPVKAVQQARLYVTGLGLYEAYLDGEKVGDEFLTPGVTAYDQWIQVQTYDLTTQLSSNGDHQLIISTGDGWYKGNYGFDGGKDCIYGDQQKALAELHLTYTDGTTDTISTDASWQTTSGQITKSAIYYGEDFDATYAIKDWQPVTVLQFTTTKLQDRLSLPIKVEQQLPVQQIITTPAGETVLDFGQNQAGWLTFNNHEPKGTKLTFQMGEILQDGNFYRGNLREARAAFTYISAGQNKWIRPHFTYFGYRYVKVSGNTKSLNPNDFKAEVLYSDMMTTGDIKTDNINVNRLFKNIQWGQKSNFMDVPTDCPQRDERLGWTGDANIFSNTAALNMNVFQFFKKYAHDMAVEQAQHNGMLTMYTPAMGVTDGGAAVWGDAATIIPWNMYENYGDPAILKQNYASMKSWVDWISRNTKTENLWTGTFQFGDWLALDGENPALPTGKTDENLIASVYYLYSTEIVAKTAKLLGYKNDIQRYKLQAANIKQAIQDEYLTTTGRLAVDTQTAYALMLHFELVPKNQIQRVVSDLVTRLHKDDDHLKTGFVGTPFICQVLSKYGAHKLAMKIFMQTDLPSWLYAVNMGATTVWERWNSVEADGSMNSEGMNSLNHYSIGAIMEWAYKYLLGIQSHDAGYKNITLAPHFDYRLKHIQGYYDTPFGRLTIESQIETDAHHTIQINLTVPFGITIQVNLPRATNVTVNDQLKPSGKFALTAGHYHLSYQPTTDYIGRYNSTTPVASIMKDSELVQKIEEIDPVLNFFKQDSDALQGGLGKMSLSKLNEILPFINISAEHLHSINELLVRTPLLKERQLVQEA